MVMFCDLTLDVDGGVVCCLTEKRFALDEWWIGWREKYIRFHFSHFTE